MTDGRTPDFGLAENIYGHVKRLEWIASHLRPGDRVLEIGCGTGFMITLPLIRAGWDAYGVDLDPESIEYGRRLLDEAGEDPDRLRCARAEELGGQFDVVIVSEVLEHVPDELLGDLLRTVRLTLKPGATLLVTVPNGYGAFEVESFLWNKLELGWLLRVTRLQDLVERLKIRLVSDPIVYSHPSSLDSSPHVQRFTLRRLSALLEAQGFEVTERRATVLVAGPLSNLLFTGVGPVMRFDSWLADRLPAISTAFMVCAVSSERVDR